MSNFFGDPIRGKMMVYLLKRRIPLTWTDFRREFCESEGISMMMITHKLRKLEKDGFIVKRRVDSKDFYFVSKDFISELNNLAKLSRLVPVVALL